MPNSSNKVMVYPYLQNKTNSLHSYLLEKLKTLVRKLNHKQTNKKKGQKNIAGRVISKDFN